MTAREPTGRRRNPLRHRPAPALLVLVGPFVVLFGLTYVLPLGYAVARSLTQQRRSGLGFGPPETIFVGLANYLQVWTSPTFVLTGSLVMVLPLVVAFLFLQRFWRAGLTLGSVKG